MSVLYRNKGLTFHIRIPNSKDIVLTLILTEIVQILDDNAMNLQSMSASRFVGPFLETVNKWEKRLSHIGEVVKVNKAVLIFLREGWVRREMGWVNQHRCQTFVHSYIRQFVAVIRAFVVVP